MLLRMRTGTNLIDDLFRGAKQAALTCTRAFTQLVEDALRATLSARADPGRQGTVRLPTSPGSPRPGVDLDDSAALLDLMQRGDDPL